MGGVDLTVILGPPGSGKAARAIDALRAAASRGDDAFLVVPGSVDRARFLRELGGRESGVLVGVEVGTFEQLVARVAGSPPVRRTDRAMERIVVRDALADVPALRGAAQWSGFVDTARRHVDQLRRARVWGGAELERVEAALPGEHVGAWHALEQRVGELLQERRLRDDAWFERRAAQRLRAGEPGVGAVVAYGFESYAAGHLELLERLARLVPVQVTLAWRPGRRVHERAADLRDRWRDMGAFIEELDAVPAAHPVLEWLGSELFEDAATEPPACEPEPTAPAPVRFVDCCGATQEVEEVVREVALVGSRGLGWDDVVVASTNAAAAGDALLAAFERAGIPARLQVRRSAIDVPAGRAVHELLDAVVRRDAIRLVAALRAPVFGVARDRVDAAELQVRGDRHGSRTLLTHPSVQRVLPDAVRELVQVELSGGEDAVPAVRAFLGSLLPADHGELDLLRGVVALVEGLVVAAGSERAIGIADVRDALGSFTLSTPDRSDTGAVVIASLEDLRSVAFDAVVLHGMHLAAFRARVDDETEAPAAARDLLHLAVTRARRTLRVVRQVAGSDGGHLAPSPAWQELRRLLPDAPLRTRRLGQVVVDPADVRTDAERAIAVAFATGRGTVVDGVEPELADRLSSARRRSRDEQVGGSLAEELAARRTIAVTEIERYVTCSAKWFIERRLRDRDPDDDRSRILDGLVAHGLLQHLVPEVRLSGQPFDVDAVRARARQLAPAIVREVDRGGELHASRVDRIIEHVVTLLEAEVSWPVPDSIEVERSFGSNLPDSIGRGFEVDGVELVGRIDRIDRHGGHVILHDYKYGSADRPASSLIEQRNLQLLVYWLALQQPGSLLEPVGALYRAVTAGGAPSGVITDHLKDLGIVGPRKGSLDHDAQEQLLDETRVLVRGGVEDLRAGVVRPLHDPAACPTHCRLQLVCRVGEVATA
jgi:hypothetical protein